MLDTGSRAFVNFNTSLYQNDQFGIDIGTTGINANDFQDADTGPNGLLNYPVITSVTSGTSTNITGTFNSIPNSNFDLYFFASPLASLSGHGEGKRYLGTQAVTTDANGNATFNTTLSAVTVSGEAIAAFAVDGLNNTSEFSVSAFANSVELPTIDPSNLILTEVLGEDGFGESTQIYAEGAVVRLDGLFTNLDATDSHTVRINWGDGTGDTTLAISLGSAVSPPNTSMTTIGRARRMKTSIPSRFM